MERMTGKLIITQGMWESVIYQREDFKFVLEEQSEMASEPTVSEFRTFHDAYKAFESHT